jgi:hypothetical protein
MDLLQVEQGVKESGEKQENSNKNGEISGENYKEVVNVGENLSQEIQITEVVMKSTYSANVDKNCSITNTEVIVDVGSKNNEGDSTKIIGEDEMARNDLKHGTCRPELMTMSTYSAIADKNCSVITTEAIGEDVVNNNEGDSDGKRTEEDNEEGNEEVQNKPTYVAIATRNRNVWTKKMAGYVGKPKEGEEDDGKIIKNRFTAPKIVVQDLKADTKGRNLRRRKSKTPEENQTEEDIVEYDKQLNDICAPALKRLGMKIRPTLANENYLLLALSYMFNGTTNKYLAMRKIAVDHMEENREALKHFVKYDEDNPGGKQLVWVKYMKEMRRNRWGGQATDPRLNQGERGGGRSFAGRFSPTMGIASNNNNYPRVNNRERKMSEKVVPLKNNVKDLGPTNEVQMTINKLKGRFGGGML